MTDLIISHSDFRALDRSVVCLPEGLTLRQMVDAAVTDPILRDRTVIEVAGEILPPDSWERVRPKPGTHVAVRMRLHGGGGGGKNPLRTILSIAVVVAAAWAAPYLAGGLAESFGLGTLEAGKFIASTTFLSIAEPLIAGAIGLVGMALVNAIAPPPTPKLAGLSGASRPESPTLSITGAQNRANPYGVVPRIYGRHRMFPLYAAQPFTMQEGDDQVLYCLFDFGLGPLALDDLRIGENPLGQFEGVETVIHERFTPQTELKLYRNDVRQDSYQIALTHDGGGQVVESASDADEVSLDITFQGLVRYSDSGGRGTRSVGMRVEYRPAGSEDPWSPILDYANATRETALTATEVPDGAWYSVYRTDTLTTGTVDLTLTIPGSWRGSSVIWGVKYAIYTRSEGETAWQRQVNTGWVVVNASYPGWVSWAQNRTVNHTLTGERGKRMEIQVALVEQSVYWVGNKNNCTWIPANSGGQGALPVPSVVYQTPRDDITISGATSQALRHPVTVRPGQRGRWEVRVTRLTPDTTSTRIQDSAVLTAVRSVTFRRPVAFQEPHTLVEMKIKATDQLNGVVSQFSAIASSILPVWDGSAWTEQETRNPAWIFADILRGAGNARPVSDDRIDLDGLKVWADACAAQAPQSDLPDAVTATEADPTWTCDMVVDYRTTVFELLRDVAACGRAAFAQPDGRFSVVRDVAQDVPVQMFTPRNSWGFRGVKTFTDVPHALKCRFVSPDKDWQQDEVIAYADGYDADTANRFETLELTGCTRASQAWREGRYQLAVGQLRPETYELQADIEALACTRGDLVVVAHDVPMLGGVAGRVRDVIRDGDDKVSALVLDEAFGMEAGTSYALRGRHADGSFSMHSLDTVPGETHEVRLATAVSPASAPDVGDLVVIGPAQRVTADMIVKEVRPGPDLTARLVLVAAAPAVHDADTGTIPAYDPRIVRTAEAAPPAVTDLTARVTGTPGDGRWRIGIDLTWAGRGAANEVYREVAGRWVLQAVVSGSSYHFFDLERAETVRYAVLAVSGAGRKLPLSQAATGVATAWDASFIPTDVRDLNLTVLGDRARLSWRVDADTVAAWWRVRWSPRIEGATWSSSVDIAPRVPYPTPSVDVPARTGTYLVKAVDRHGQESRTVAMAATSAPDLMGFNVIETMTESGPFPGARTAVYAADDGLRLASAKTVGAWPSIAGVPLISYGSDGVARRGTYEFTAPLDLGQVHTCRVSAGMDVLGADPFNRVGVWQSVAGRTSVTGTDPSQYDVLLEISTSREAPSDAAAWSDWSAFQVGDYRARAFRFRAVLTSDTGEITPVVTDLSVTIDMPDAVQGEDDLMAGTGGRVVAFPRPFKALKALAVTGDALSSGDRWEVTNRSATGFTVHFFDQTGAAVERRFDYLAKGY